MLYYSSTNWFEPFLYYVGTVWPHIRGRFCIVTIYAVSAYAFALVEDSNLGAEGRTILFGTMSFLLIFRANQAYKRYWQGCTVMTEFFSDIREFIMVTLIYIRGGLRTSTFLFHGGPGVKPKTIMPEDAFDDKARDMRVDIVRLCVAMAVAYKLHSRIALEGYCFGKVCKRTKWCIDYDRLRLRQLLTLEEFDIVDELIGIDDPDRANEQDPLIHLSALFSTGGKEGPTEPPEDWPEEFSVKHCGPTVPVAIVYMLREVCFRNTNDLNDPHDIQPWGIKERFQAPLEGLLLSMQYAFEEAHQIMTTPVPLPYANLCKTLLSVFLLSLPFFVDRRLGWFANVVIPPVTALALLGIDAIATELENPFGDDDNDLDVLSFIGTLEREAMEMMRLAGDEEGCARFCWRDMPGFVRRCSSRSLSWQLAMKDFLAPVQTSSKGGKSEPTGYSPLEIA